MGHLENNAPKPLGEYVDQYYKEETQVIKETGTLWKKFALVGWILFVLRVIALLNHDHWPNILNVLAIISFFTVPYALRAWDRYKVAQEMRDWRRIQIDMKLDALLGIIKVGDEEA